MNFRLTGFLALLATFLGALILLWDGDENTTSARLEQARRAFRFDPARVDRLLLEAGELTIECRRAEREWRLVRPLEARADPIALERLLGALQELPLGDILLPPPRPEGTFAPFGLEPPRATLSLVSGVVTNRILIGRRTPLGDGIYVRQADQPALARLNLALLDLLPTSADALRDRSLLAGAPADIVRVDIRGPAGYVQLARDEAGAWRIYQPFTARAAAPLVTAIIEKMLACSIVQFVQDTVSDLAPYGLDSQSAVTVVFNTDSGNGSQMLALGDPLPNDPSLVYARLQGENSIYAVPADARQSLLVHPEDLRDRRLPGLDADTIATLRVETADAALELQQDATDTWQIITPLRVAANPMAIQDLLRSWADVRLDPAPDAPTNLPPWSRLIRITPRSPKAAPLEIHVAPIPDDPTACWLAIEGESAISRATPAAPLTSPLDPLRYHSLDIASVPLDDIERIRIATPTQGITVERDAATGQWSPPTPWVDRLLAVLTPLRAASIVPATEAPGDAVDAIHPFLLLTVQQRGQSALATTLTVGRQATPDGARYATLRGRDFLFISPAWTIEALLPPAENP